MGRKARTIRLRTVLDRIKVSRGCALHQPAMYPCMLDLHHLDPKTKSFHITEMEKNGPARIVQEIQKCVVLRKDMHTAVEHGVITLPTDIEAIKLTYEELAAIYAAARPSRRLTTPTRTQYHLEQATQAYQMSLADLILHEARIEHGEFQGSLRQELQGRQPQGLAADPAHDQEPQGR